MFAPPPDRNDDEIDAYLDRMDGAVEKITARTKKKPKKKSGLHGLNTQQVKKTRMVFQQLAESSLVSESGDDILMESREMTLEELRGEVPPPQLKPTVVLDKNEARKKIG